MIYLDHNATTKLHPRALEAMMPYLQGCWGNPSSPYRFGHQARTAVEGARERIAEAIGCKPSELVFCASGTEANNLALRGALREHRSRGNHIVSSSIEHPAVLSTCAALESEGYRVTYVPVTSDGLVSLTALRDAISKETILVSVMHANNETGVVQPIEQIAELTQGRGILFHTDAAQSTGKLPFRVAELGADLVSFSAHKLQGPKGAAALYAREGARLAPLVTGGDQERGLRAGTENVAALVGFAEAMAVTLEDLASEAHRLRVLRDRFERGVVAAVPNVRINGACVGRVPNTANLSFEDIDGESIVLGLDVLGFCVSTGSACSTGSAEPSHVLRAMGLTRRAAQCSIRVSLGRTSCEEHIDAAVRALASTVARLRTITSVRDATG
jgi:cysteine desulfurase